MVDPGSSPPFNARCTVCSFGLFLRLTLMLFFPSKDKVTDQELLPRVIFIASDQVFVSYLCKNADSSIQNLSVVILSLGTSLGLLPSPILLPEPLTIQLYDITFSPLASLVTVAYSALDNSGTISAKTIGFGTGLQPNIFMLKTSYNVTTESLCDSRISIATLASGQQFIAFRENIKAPDVNLKLFSRMGADWSFNYTIIAAAENVTHFNLVRGVLDDLVIAVINNGSFIYYSMMNGFAASNPPSSFKIANLTNIFSMTTVSNPSGLIYSAVVLPDPLSNPVRLLTVNADSLCTPLKYVFASSPWPECTCTFPPVVLPEVGRSSICVAGTWNFPPPRTEGLSSDLHWRPNSSPSFLS